MADKYFLADDDGGGDVAQEPDAHGFAALLLIESLIHELIARSALSRQAAVDLVAAAADVSADIAVDIILIPSIADRTRDLLNAIRATLEIDLPSGTAD